MFSNDDNDNRNLKILSLSFFIYFIGWGIVLPYMPIYFNNIVKNYSLVGIVFGIPFLFQTLTSIPIGDLVDKIGKKAILVVSWLQYIFLGALYANVSNIIILIVTRIYNSLSATGLWVSGISTTRQLSKDGHEAKSMGIFNTGWLSGRVLGAIIASVLVLYISLNYLFYFLSIFGFLAAIVALKELSETGKHREKLKQGVKDVVYKDHIFAKEIKDFLSEPKQAKIAISYLLQGFIFTIMIMILSLFLDSLKGELWQIGLIYAVLYFPFIFQFELGELGDRMGRKRIILLGSVLASISFSILFFIESLGLIFIFALIVGLGIALITPCIEAYITDVSHGHEGETTGIFRTVRSLGAGIGPIIAGFISELYSLNLVFLFAGLLILLIPITIFWYDG